MRTLDFLVDIPHARRVNEQLAELRRLQVSAGIFAVAMVGGAIGLFIVGQTWAIITAIVLIVAAAACAYAGIVAPQRAADLKKMYGEHELVPAVVTAVRPRGFTMMALVNLTRDRTREPRWALIPRRAQNLPGHRVKVGERVPCVAVTDASKMSQYWQRVQPVPIAWAARDEEVLKRAQRAISKSEWIVLERNVKRGEEAEKSRGYLTLTASELPSDLR
ncbi:DUF3239 domain-containing protein [Hoyosella subflava]|uniref:Uncharacterized protein n=1 Tax=Hoyosella subflava (strain DSM 45089 / JCM 17490 / NBRC 109087 / DQS3-9A1) TaxID=443218 RepID=F6EM57_HOYSD|nr:DUF3239 domain-containing protein [Hoyosella subflava]AEF39263.1 hypothetical protein AS9A_0811 [Hoyosella subflava DQS3-9A1]